MSATADIGQRLSAAMARRGLNAATLAAQIGINRQTIWRYQTGRSAQSLLLMARIAEFLQVRLDFLAYGTGRMVRPKPK